MPFNIPNFDTGGGGGITAVANVGAGSGNIFRNITGTTANLRSLESSDSSLSITTNADTVDLVLSDAVLQYTVGPPNTGAQFTSIQAAIGQAVADGADGATPAEILIFPDTYIESPIASNGGIILRGSKTRDAGVLIAGSVTFTNSAAGPVNVYAVVGCNVSGVISNTGVAPAGGFFELIQSTCSLFDASGFLGPSLNALVQNSEVTGTSDVLQGTSVTEWTIQNSQLNASTPATRVFPLSGSALQVTNTDFSGYVESTAAGASANFERCSFTTSGQPGYVSASTATERIQICSFDRQGAAGPAIVSTAAGLIQISGNTVNGNVSQPYVLATGGGAFDRGDNLEGQRTTLNQLSMQQQPIIDFVEGPNITITQTPDAANGRVSYEFSAAGGGSGGAGEETFNLPIGQVGQSLFSGSSSAHYDRIIAKSNVTVTRMACWIVQTAGGNVQMGIYNSAGTLLQSTAIVALGGTGLQIVALSASVALVAGTPYIFALWTSANGSQFLALTTRYSAGGGPNIGRFQNSGIGAGLPTPWGGSLDASRFYIAGLPA
jgi:hypothetical protein